MTDASAYGLGVFSLHRSNDGSWNTVSFTSRQLKNVELAYPVLEKDCLAAAHALKKSALLAWRSIRGRHSPNFAEVALEFAGTTRQVGKMGVGGTGL